MESWMQARRLHRKSGIQLHLHQIIISLIILILGLSVWLYLPIRSSTNPAFHLHSINSSGDFIAYLTRKVYEGKGTAGLAAIPLTLLKSVQIMIKNIGLYGLFILGFITWNLMKEKANRNVIPYFLTNGILILVFSIFLPLSLIYIQMVGMDVYFIPFLILWIPIVTVGLNRLFQFIRGRMRYLLLIPIPIIIWSRWEKHNLSGNNGTTDFLNYLTASLPENAEIIALSDALIYPLIYNIYAEENPRNYNFLMHKHLDDPEKDWWTAYVGKKNVFTQMDELFQNNLKNTATVHAGGLFPADPG